MGSRQKKFEKQIVLVIPYSAANRLGCCTALRNELNLLRYAMAYHGKFVQAWICVMKDTTTVNEMKEQKLTLRYVPFFTILSQSHDRNILFRTGMCLKIVFGACKCIIIHFMLRVTLVLFSSVIV